MTKGTINAKVIVADIKAGLDDSALMDKYQLSEKGLKSVFKKLADVGALKQEDLDSRLSSHERTVEVAWKCPACGAPQTKRPYVCPDCGVIVAKFMRTRAIRELDEGPQCEVLEEAKPVSASERTPFVEGRTKSDLIDAANATASYQEPKPWQCTIGPRKENPIPKDGLIRDLNELNFVYEVFPVGERNIGSLMGDFNFWFISCLGVVPLMIPIIWADNSSQIVALSLFFAFVWGVVFRKLVMQESAGWLLPIGALFFTGVLGVSMLLLAYAWVPSAHWALHSRSNTVLKLWGYIFLVGVPEELCKAVPIFVYIAWERMKERAIDPLTLIVIGVFSGLGFAAFENMGYAEAFAARLDTKDAMIGMIVRSLSAIFSHASLSGIFAYFMAVAADSGKRWGALFVVGLGLTSLLHGLYDWFCITQPILAALTAGFSFMLFYSYMSKVRSLVASAR